MNLQRFEKAGLHHSRMSDDSLTADAFATSWNHLPNGSVYTLEQFTEWMQPLVQDDFAGKTVLELGCGNASLLMYTASWGPSFVEGVDLGDSVVSAERNMAELPARN
jgi:2-polyprenyl-3-methyl-5-hydroxy-6-metoxy-1,4-benzoquinol methylase